MAASCLRSQIQSLKRKLEGWNERAKDFTLSEASATQDHENNVAKLIPKSLSGGSRVSSSLGPTGRPVVFGWKTMLQIWTISTYELKHVFTAVSEIRGGLELSSMFAGKGSHSSFSLLFFQPVIWHRIGLCVKKIHVFKMHQVRKWQQMERHEKKTATAGSLSIAKQRIVCLSAFTAGYKSSFVMEILSSGRDSLEELPPLLSMADISHLCLSLTHCPPEEW